MPTTNDKVARRKLSLLELAKELHNSSERVQERSRHTHRDPELTAKHTQRDTSRNRMLISRQFAYFGAEAVELPTEFEDERGYTVCLDGSGTPNGELQRARNFDDAAVIARFEAWLEATRQWGCV